MVSWEVVGNQDVKKVHSDGYWARLLVLCLQNPYGVKCSAELLIKLAWETALAMVHENQNVRLLLSDFREAVASWTPTGVYFQKSVDAIHKMTPGVIAAIMATFVFAPQVDWCVVVYVRV